MHHFTPITDRKIRLALVGCGRALPAASISNDQLSERVETNDDWIRSRTGMERPTVIT